MKRETLADMLADALQGSEYSGAVAVQVYDPNGGPVALLGNLLDDHFRARGADLRGAALASFVRLFAHEEAEHAVLMFAEREEERREGCEADRVDAERERDAQREGTP